MLNNFIKKNNRIIYLVTVLAIVIGIFALIISVQRPMSMDEIDFFIEGLSVMHTGFPSANGLWHPPLYIFILGGFLKLMGGSLVAGKILGVMFLLMTFFVMQLTIPGLVKKENVKTARIMFTIMFFLSSFLIQQSTLVDIDSSIIPFIFSLFLLVMVRMKDSMTKYLFLTLIIGLSFAAKLFPAPLLVFSFLLYLTFKYKNIKMVLKGVYMSLGGLLFFWLSWISLAALGNFNKFAFTNLLFSRLVQQADTSFFLQQIRQIIYSVSWNVAWFSIPLFIVLIIYVISRIKNFVKKKSIDKEDFILVFSTLMFFFFSIIRPTGGGMKYQFSAYLFFTFLIAIFLTREFNEKDKKIFTSKKIFKRNSIFLLSIGVLSIIFALLINRTIINNFVETYLFANYFDTNVFVESLLKLPIALTVLGVSLVSSSLLLYFKDNLKIVFKEKKYVYLLLSLFLFVYYLYLGDVLLHINSLDVLFLVIYFAPFLILIPLIIGISKSSYRILLSVLLVFALISTTTTIIHQSTSNYIVAVSWNNYGEKGQMEMSDYIKSLNLNRGELIARKDVGFYVYPKFQDQKEIQSSDLQLFQENKSQYKIDLAFYRNTFFVWDEKIHLPIYEHYMTEKNIKYVEIDQYAALNTSRKLLANNFVLDKKIGDFEIYRRIR